MLLLFFKVAFIHISFVQGSFLKVRHDDEMLSMRLNDAPAAAYMLVNCAALYCFQEQVAG